MAGAKGRSGGARLNAGGARPGAGRKKKSAANVPVVQPEQTDMLTLLQNVALGLTEATALQVRAAIAAVQYTHTKRAEGGKKEERRGAAKKAGTGRFSSASPPRTGVVLPMNRDR